MSYGSTAYGSAALGGSAANEWYLFLPYQSRSPASYEAELEFFGSEQYFSLFLQKATEEIPVVVEPFTRNDLGETPQSQGTFDGQFAQYVIAAARYIKVVATVVGSSNLFSIRGRPGD